MADPSLGSWRLDRVTARIFYSSFESEAWTFVFASKDVVEVQHRVDVEIVGSL